MDSFLRWVDFSSEDRERMQRAIALARAEETRDELGLGTVRDLFADAMFPGTSTIHTRLRYFLFVPWMYQRLEAKRLAPHLVARRARQQETALIEPLLASGDTTGVLGKRAGAELKRLPSSVYWAGLGEWGIRVYDGSQHQYHRAFQELRRHRAALQVPEDEGVELETLHTWYPRIPEPPAEWPEEADFDITLDEAEFFKGRIEHSHGASLLSWLAREGHGSDCRYIWAHPELGRMRLELRHEVDLARRFSLVMHGAALLYNVIVAELASQDEREAGHRFAMEQWAEGPERDDLRHFDLAELFTYLDEHGARVPQRTRSFVERWVGLVKKHHPADLVDEGAARKLVSARESDLKGPRSRITSAQARQNWSGASGVGRLDFRWPTVRGLLNDLHGSGPANEDVEAG